MQQKTVILAKDIPEVFSKYENVLNKLKNKLKKIQQQKGLEHKKTVQVDIIDEDTIETATYKYKIAIKIVKQEIKEAKKAAPKIDSEEAKQARKRERAEATKKANKTKEKSSISSRLLRSRNSGSKNLGIRRPHPKKEE